MTPKPKTECELSKIEKKFLEHRANKKYTEAQAYLVRKIPMLGIPLLETLPSVISYSVKAMATDGTCIVYNPEWVVKQPMLELVHVIAHEVAHVAFKHMTRRKNRDQKLWNVATDYQVNSYLHLMGVGQKPKTCLYEEKYNGMTMTSDAIYEDLIEDSEPEESPDNKQGDDESESSCDSGNTPHQEEIDIAASYGWVDDYDGGDPEAFSKDAGYDDDGDPIPVRHSPADIQELESQIEEAIAHGEFAHKKISGDELPVSINEILEPANIDTIDWQDALEEFLTEKVKTCKNWNRPHKKWLQQGFWLPSKASYGLKDIVIMNDESGSMNEDENQACLTNIDELAQLGIISFERLDVMHFTSRVGKIEYFEPGDDIQYIRHSSGGTCFHSVFDKAQEMEQDGLIDPSCYVVLTDMYDDFPPEPDHPVLWMSVTHPETLYSYNCIPEYGKLTHLSI
jgi:predicted metal-dependent peptidase